MTTQFSLCSRITTSILMLALICLSNARALNAQDISGGAGVLLVSADVEARLGKGIFTSPQNVAHAPKRLEKKTVARVRSAHTRQTTGGGGQEANNGGGSGSGPLGGAPRRVLDAEGYNKQGDDLFDKGQYDKALESYQQAVKLKPAYAEALLNVGQTFFNLGKYDEAVAAEKQAIALKPDWAEPYAALGSAYLKLEKVSEALEPLHKAIALDPKDTDARNSLSLAYYDQGVAAYNANKY